jgi:uncharacterized protein YgbK (DUF1537 family)
MQRITMNQSFNIGVIADDFTGAMDAGAQFARYGLTTAFAVSAAPACQALVLNTASREVPPEQAGARCAEAAARLAGRQLFKKIDSTLRGHLGAELSGLQQAAHGAKLVVCPAAPQQGRAVKDGILTVNNIPLHESAFKNDPAFPARTSRVAERIGIPATHIPLEFVRRSAETLAERITAAPEGVVTIDAVEADDLRCIGQAALLAGAIPCGALGLADAWCRALTGREPQGPGCRLPSGKGPVLIVAGSANASTHQQLSALAAHAESLVCPIRVPLTAEAEAALFNALQAAWDDRRAVALCPAIRETVRDPAWLSFGKTVSRLAAEVIRRQRPACVFIAGGETANALCDLLAVESVSLAGEALPGIPYGRLEGGPADGVILITKAGGFGQADCMERIVYG